MVYIQIRENECYETEAERIDKYEIRLALFIKKIFHNKKMLIDENYLGENNNLTYNKLFKI